MAHSHSLLLIGSQMFLFIDFITLHLELLVVSQMSVTFVAEKQHSNKIETMTLNVHKSHQPNHQRVVVIIFL